MEEPESVGALVVAGFGDNGLFKCRQSFSEGRETGAGVSFIDTLFAEVSVSCGVAMDAMMSIQARKALKTNAVAPKCKAKRLHALMMRSGSPKYACALAAQ